MTEPLLVPGTVDPKFLPHQVDPSRQAAYYKFSYGPTVLAELIAVADGSNRYSFEANREYWRFNKDLTSIDTYVSPDLNVTKVALDWSTEPPFPPSQADFVCSLTPTWKAVDTKAPPIDCQYYDDSFGPCGFRLKVDRRDTRSEWTGTIVWVRPMERFAPLFANQDTYRLTQATIGKGVTVVNRVGTHWTDAITNYSDGDWRDPVVVPELATGLQVNYGGYKIGIANLRMAYADRTFSAWASNDVDGTNEPPDSSASRDVPLTQTLIRTGYYMNYSLGLVDLDYGGGWVTGFDPDGTKTLPVVLPDRCAVVGIQGKHRAGYGLVDLKLAYRELP